MESGVTPGEVSVLVLTVSDRSFAGERQDRSGPIAIGALREAGFEASGVLVIPDGAAVVERSLAVAVEEGIDVIFTVGGTGAGPRDETPEATRPLIDRDLPGITEELRAAGAVKVPTALLSRGLAGISRPSASGHRAVIVNLPGSSGGARDGVELLAPILPHLIDQIRGGDH